MVRMDEDRLIEIESKLAHQEHALVDLNKVITCQQQQIEALELRCQSLLDRIKALSDGAGSIANLDERPPHY